MACPHQVSIDVIRSKSLQEIITEKTNAANIENEDDPFYLVDISDVINKYKTLFFKVFFITHIFLTAMKSNPDFQIAATLCGLGTGLDVASAGEIETAVAVGLKDEDVIYSNTCKGISHLKVAAKENLTQMTFDSEVELHRIKRLYPSARLVLRLLVDDSHSELKLGVKAGASFSRVPHLLKVAKELGLNVIGTSFHVGSECGSPDAYAKAIEKSRRVFDIAKGLGMKFNLLDIGGGYPGQINELFTNISRIINKALDIHFPSDSGVRIISEPGQYFSCSSSILVANIISKRIRFEDDDTQIEGYPSDKENMEITYHINEGVIGAFISKLIINLLYIPKKLIKSNEKCYRSSMWGPTCTPVDQILSDYNLPEMEVGEWVYYEIFKCVTRSENVC
ncbi:uncharacterized protein TRIADDRAFT_60902 [Trichoplax adhaerens]|uniref:Orn/DAP/Arg decarboxylase 2 N-terminal domain-containing protein n=1 Tax=Trichoplax adhaerens TaxID=10228 RepID=B3S9G8_TRIAD|nr:hypothetical protein TRIADDRAFT_60902 [Trichoplax adhaerens]EDV20647.1 hypothetical protein TRIADDRAFT_60902 [Trichoplax adhaerens]|eukprot:XP_002116847.1 hypothetical protein TRIADDRAFT_60902 [Trichoplax adhaerens]